MTASHVYDIRNWEQAETVRDGILIRPGQKILNKRLVLFVIGLATLVPLGVVYYAAPQFAHTWTLRNALIQEATMFDTTENDVANDSNTLQAQRQARDEARQKREAHLTNRMQQAILLFMISVLVIGTLAPISCLWNCLRIETTPRGDIVVFHQGVLLSSTREWPIRGFRCCAPHIKEVRRNNRFGQYHVWWFCVRLMPAVRGGARIEFQLVESMAPTSAYGSNRMQQFAEALEQLTGLPAHGFDEDVGVESSGRADVRQTTTAPAATRRVYHSVEDAPHELRERFTLLKEQACRSGSPSASMETITVEKDGVAHTYHSLEEMPPELRERYAQLKRVAQGRSAPPGITVETEDIIIETPEDA